MVTLTKQLRDAVLKSAIQGKLTRQLLEDGNPKEILPQIKAEKEKLIKEKKIKKEKPLSKIDDVPFDIPDNWVWEKMGNVAVIERGGSPRPISEYITTSDNGINWIKIGDTEKNGKYICSTNEKIKPEGQKKSRYVKPGDFLLTNSMSFGRPYILKTDGCIHDGWLVISQPVKIFDENYLYLLLSSDFTYSQFCEKVSGAVVKNLNIDKVADSVFPIPPLKEQKRIVSQVEELMSKIDEYEKIENQLTKLKEKFPNDMKAALLQAAMQGKITGHNYSEDDDDSIFVPLWSVTWWDKKFKKVAKGKQDKTISYHYYLAAEMEAIAQPQGNVFLLSTGDYSGWTTEEKVGDNMAEGEIVSIPWGGGPTVKYYKGKFVTSDNRIATSKDTNVLLNKFLYYYMLSQKEYLDSIYRGTGLRHPDMEAVLDMNIPVMPIEEQQRIVDILDKMLPMCDELNI